VRGRAARFVAVLATALLAFPGDAHPQAGPTISREDAETNGRLINVRLMTMGQGDAIWERFGHNALWLSYARSGRGIAYNWGIFDFRQPGFVARFLTGDTRYWMDGFDAYATATVYQQLDRSVHADQLVLSDRQRGELDAYVRWNQLPDNKFYTYDYFLNNCSTLLRDVLDRALGGTIRRQTEKVGTGTSFRSHTQRMLEGQPLAYTGITIALGQPADREISAWEEMFLPGKLRDHVLRIQVDTGDGRLQPLIRDSVTLYRAQRPPEPAVAGSFVRYFVGAGVLIGALLLGAGAMAQRGIMRPLFATVASVWLVIAGLVGLILTLAWGVTRHVFWYRNENLFLLNPLLLVLAFMIPFALRRDASDAMRRRAALLSIAVAGLGVLGLVLKALPWLYQKNWEVIALVLPAHVAIAAVMWRSSRRMSS
jgi:hypothetical protein